MLLMLTERHSVQQSGGMFVVVTPHFAPAQLTGLAGLAGLYSDSRQVQGDRVCIRKERSTWTALAFLVASIFNTAPGVALTF